MFNNLFKRRWISDEAIDYLLGLPKMFRVYYTKNVNGSNIKFLIRDEDGNMVADVDWFAKGVNGIALQYQEDGEIVSRYISDYVGKETIPYLKGKFDKFVAKYPSTKSKVKSDSLYNMQHKLRKEIERVTNVRGAYDGKDIVYNLSGITQSDRDSVIDLLRRMDNSCVPVTVMITMSGATDEEIGSTLNELAMTESEKFVEENEEN